MAEGRTTTNSLVVFCGCAYYDVIPTASKEAIFHTLQQAGVEVEAVADLCALAAARDKRLDHWARAESLAIVACFPRAVRGLFQAAGISLPADRVQYFNMRTQTPEEIIAALSKGRRSTDVVTGPMPQKEDGWVPWFPVIDADRCKNCKQCLNFCLFGVYGLSSEGHVEVQKPDGCKTNCPACARMCPAQAIIFPKYAESPISGDEVPESAAPTEKAAPDMRGLIKGNLYDTIRRREPGRRRFSTEPNDPSVEQPASSLEGLRQELGIPMDVLTSLSPAEVQRIRKTSPTEPREP